MLEASGEVTEVSEVRTYRGFVNGVAVTIDVNDRGSGAFRYSVDARRSVLPSDPAASSTTEGYYFGNPDRDLDVAISGIRWNQVLAGAD